MFWSLPEVAAVWRKNSIPSHTGFEFAVPRFSIFFRENLKNWVSIAVPQTIVFSKSFILEPSSKTYMYLVGFSERLVPGKQQLFFLALMFLDKIIVRKKMETRFSKKCLANYKS